MTRVVTNGGEMWEFLRCRDGRVVVSSCMYEREMRPRQDLTLGNPPQVAVRRLPAAGERHSQPARRVRDAAQVAPLKLTLVGGTDKTTNAETDSPATNRATAPIATTSPDRHDRFRRAAVRVCIAATTCSCCPACPKARREPWSRPGHLAARSWPRASAAFPRRSQHGVNGLLVEPNDSLGLAAAIERILTDEAAAVAAHRRRACAGRAN